MEGVNAYFSKGIIKISIYKDGAILYSCNSSKLEPKYLDSKNTIESNEYMHNIKSITLQKAIKQARKLDMNRKDNFYITESNSYETGYALYIHASEISVETLGEYLRLETAGEKDYQILYKLTFNHGATYTAYILEEYASIDDVIAKYGDYQVKNKWATKTCPFAESFDKTETKAKYPKLFKNRDILLKGVRVEYQEERTITSELFTQQGYSRVEKNDNRIEREKIAELCKSKNINLSHYDIEKLQTVLNISIK